MENIVELLSTKPQCFSLKRNEPKLLQAIGEFLLFQRENERSLDFFATMFLFNVKVFRVKAYLLKNLGSGACLMSREMVYAMHTNQ